MPMPIPSTVQAMTSPMMPCAEARITNPVAMTRFEQARRTRPPWRSIKRPIDGPMTADRSSAAENRPKNMLVGRCRAVAIGAPSIAGHVVARRPGDGLSDPQHGDDGDATGHHLRLVMAV